MTEQLMETGLQSDYDRIFHPRKIAIVGVSSKGTGFGSGIFHSLRNIGYSGEIFLVNPRGGSLNGEAIYTAVDQIPGTFDLAIIAVAARAVPEILEACRQKGAAGAEILSSGFRELGTEEGLALENEIREIAAKGIRVIGPNCFGIYCPASGLTVLPGPDLSRETGPVAFSSQSGGMAVDFANTGKSIGLKFSKVVSFGNGADLRETDLLQYFGNDPETGIVAMYIEGVADGEAFFSALRQTAARKPVIVYKGGLSAAGERAVRSHTASMGGSREIWRSIIKQAGAVQVESMEEMARASLALSLLPGRTYRDIAVLGGGGALGVSAADSAEEFGIGIPPFEPVLAGRIEELLPQPGSSAANPVDVANPFVPPKVLKEVLLLGAQDDRIDLQIFISLLHHYTNVAKMFDKPLKEVTPYMELADDFREVMDRTGKPVMVVIPNPKRGSDHIEVVDVVAEARRAFIERGIPVFDELDDSLEALGHVNAYYGGRDEG